MTKKCVNSFWTTDLEDIEGTFLKKGRKITDLPEYLDRRVPPQGSVLLGKNRAVLTDEPGVFCLIAYRLKKLIHSSFSV
jgi:hypothetical protein